MSGAGSAEAEDVVKQIQDVQSRDISLEEKNRLINSILSHSSSRYRSSSPSRFMIYSDTGKTGAKCRCNLSSKKCNYICSK